MLFYSVRYFITFPLRLLPCTHAQHKVRKILINNCRIKAIALLWMQANEPLLISIRTSTFLNNPNCSNTRLLFCAFWTICTQIKTFDCHSTILATITKLSWSATSQHVFYFTLAIWHLTVAYLFKVSGSETVLHNFSQEIVFRSRNAINVYSLHECLNPHHRHKRYSVEIR